jgi:hypothetical protein
MLLTVHCESCGGAEVGRLETTDVSLLMSMMLAAHASPPHSGCHRLVCKVDGGGIPEGAAPVDFRIECLVAGCNAQPTTLAGRIPREYIGAHCLSFHSHHEGHRHRWSVNGSIVFESPA